MNNNRPIKSYKLKNGDTKYKFRIYLGRDPMTGRRLTTSRSGFNSYAEARATYNELIFNKEIKKNHNPHFKTVYLEWLTSYENRVEPSTFVTTESLMRNHVLPVFGKFYIAKITTPQIQLFVNDMAPKLAKYRELISYMSDVFKYAIALNYCDNDPTAFITYPRNMEKSKKRPTGRIRRDINYYDEKQLLTLLECCREHCTPMWYAYFRLIAMTGMRKSEALALEWSDINVNKCLISITKTRKRSKNGPITGLPKTSKSYRVIAIDEDTIKALARWKSTQTRLLGIQKIMFTNSKGNYVTSSHPLRRLYSVIDKYNLPHTDLHGLRHTHTSILVRAGIPVADIMDRLGHEDIKTTMNIYTHITNEEKEKNVTNFINHLDEARHFG